MSSSKLNYKSITINYLSHSGFLIEYNEHKILIDPFLEGNNSNNPLAKLKCNDIKATDILLTHGHYDHSIDARKIAKNNNCKITATPELSEWFKKEGNITNKAIFGGSMLFPWGKAYFRYAMHGNTTPDGKPISDPATSILLSIDDTIIYHLGDTALQLDFNLVKEVYKPDIVMIPIGGNFTMDIQEAVIATKWLGAKIVIPMHYNTDPIINVDVDFFKKKVEKDNPSCTCHILEVADTL